MLRLLPFQLTDAGLAWSFIGQSGLGIGGGTGAATGSVFVCTTCFPECGWLAVLEGVCGLPCIGVLWIGGFWLEVCPGTEAAAQKTPIAANAVNAVRLNTESNAIHYVLTASHGPTLSPTVLD